MQSLRVPAAHLPQWAARAGAASVASSVKTAEVIPKARMILRDCPQHARQGSQGSERPMCLSVPPRKAKAEGFGWAEGMGNRKPPTLGLFYPSRLP